MTAVPSKGTSYNANHIVLLHERPNEDVTCILNDYDNTDVYDNPDDDVKAKVNICILLSMYYNSNTSVLIYFFKKLIYLSYCLLFNRIDELVVEEDLDLDSTSDCALSALVAVLEKDEKSDDDVVVVCQNKAPAYLIDAPASGS